MTERQPGSDPIGELQRWLVRSGARSVSRQLGDQVRTVLGGSSSSAHGDVWESATADHEAPECQWCPICRARRRLRESGPGLSSTFSAAGDAVSVVLQDAAAAFEAAVAAAGRQARPRDEAPVSSEVWDEATDDGPPAAADRAGPARRDGGTGRDGRTGLRSFHAAGAGGAGSRPRLTGPWREHGATRGIVKYGSAHCRVPLQPAARRAPRRGRSRCARRCGTGRRRRPGSPARPPGHLARTLAAGAIPLADSHVRPRDRPGDRRGPRGTGHLPGPARPRLAGTALAGRTRPGTGAGRPVRRSEWRPGQPARLVSSGPGRPQQRAAPGGLMTSGGCLRAPLASEHRPVVRA